MLRKIKYVNHQGEELKFGENGLYISENDLLDFSWNIKSENEKISGFKKGIISRKVPIVIKGNVSEVANQLRNRVFEVFEKDVIAKQYGRFVIGDYYLKCYVTESAKRGFHRSSNFIQNTIKVTTDLPYWIKESHYFYAARKQIVVNNQDTYMDYPYDHAYDYSATILAYTIGNQSLSGADFSMIIYGSCTNPTVKIGDHQYMVGCELDADEYLVIDSAKRKVYKVLINGEMENQFHLRNREYNIFQKIPEGDSTITWDGSFSFDLTLYEGRSEPRWT